MVRAVGEIDMVNAHRWGEVLAELGHDLGHHDDDPRRSPITALGLDGQLCIDAHLVTAITHALRRRR